MVTCWYQQQFGGTINQDSLFETKSEVPPLFPQWSSLLSDVRHSLHPPCTCYRVHLPNCTLSTFTCSHRSSTLCGVSNLKHQVPGLYFSRRLVWQQFGRVLGRFMIVQISYRFWLVSWWSAAASAPSVPDVKDGVSAEQRFLWAAKLLFVPRLCILISCTVHSNKKRD